MPCVLIIDGDADIRAALRDVLEDEGFTVRAAANGEEALSEVRRKDAPHLVLVDAMTPKAGAEPVLDWIAARKDFHDIPVVILTSETKPVPDGRAVAILRKPFDLEELLRIAHQFCKAGSER